MSVKGASTTPAIRIVGLERICNKKSPGEQRLDILEVCMCEKRLMVTS